MSSGTSKTAVAKKDVQRLARNTGAALQELHSRCMSLGLCFDILLSVLDKLHAIEDGDSVVTNAVKAELERRKNAAKPKEPNANSPSEG